MTNSSALTRCSASGCGTGSESWTDWRSSRSTCSGWSTWRCGTWPPRVAEFLDVADQIQELGYTSIKLHTWGDWRRDAYLCVALREHVGDGFPLAYDGSAGFDLPDAIRLGTVLTEAGYL